MHEFDWMNWWKKDTAGVDFDAIMRGWTEEIARAYQGGDLRWARICGKRWEYVSGSSPEMTYSSIRLPINSEIGLCLANTGGMDRRELSALQNSIKESLECRASLV